MEDKEKSKSYKVKKITIILDGITIPGKGAAESAVEAKKNGELKEWASQHHPFDQVRFPSTSFAEAKQVSEHDIEACRIKVEEGDLSAVVALVDKNPFALNLDWVANAYIQARSEPIKKRRGRPKGSYKEMSPEVLVGLVYHLINTQQASSPEDAFGWLEQRGLRSYASAKDAFYDALKNTGPHGPGYTESEERDATPEDIALLESAIRVQPGDEFYFPLCGSLGSAKGDQNEQ